MRVLLLGFLVVSLPGLIGCGGGSDGRVPVSGIVTLDGNPLEGATVTYRPGPGTQGNGGFGTTGPDGHFEITYQNARGLVPGTYRVTVTRMPKGEAAKGLIDAPTRGAGGIPARYSHPRETILEASVEPGGKPVVWALTSDPEDVKR